MSDTQNSPRIEWTPERVALAGKFLGLIITGGILLGLFAAAMQMYWIAAAIVFLLLAVVVSWQFEAALAIYVLIAFVLLGRTPDLAVGGSGSGKGVFISEIMLVFLLAIWVGRGVCSLLPKNRIKSGFHIPLAIYIVYCVVNVANSYFAAGDKAKAQEFGKKAVAAAEADSPGLKNYVQGQVKKFDE